MATVDTKYTLKNLLGLLLFLGILSQFVFPVFFTISKYFSLADSKQFFVDPYFANVLKVSILQALASVVLSALLGLWGAFLYSERPNKIVSFLFSFSQICFQLPPLVIVLAFIGSFGEKGFLPFFNLFSWTGILLIHAFFNFSLFFRIVGAALAQKDRSSERAALNLGVSRFFCFFKITLPQIQKNMAQAAALSFLYCFHSFIILITLGGGPWYTTLEVNLYQAIKINFQPEVVASLLLVQIGIGLAIFLWQRKIKSNLQTHSNVSLPVYFPRTQLLSFIFEKGYYFISVIFIVVPLFTLFLEFFSFFKIEDKFEILEALVVTFKLAVVASFFSVFLCLALATVARFGHSIFRKIYLGVLNIPIYLSALALTSCWALTYPSVFFQGRGNFFLIALLQGLFSIPLVYAALERRAFEISDKIFYSAKNLGAPSFLVFLKITLPLLKRALLQGWVLAMAFCLGETTILLLLYSTEFMPINLLIYQKMSKYQFQEALAASSVLLVASFVLYAIETRLGEHA